MARTSRYDGPPKPAKKDRFLSNQPNLQRLFEKENPRLRGAPGDPLKGLPFPGAVRVEWPPELLVPMGQTRYCPYCRSKLRMAKLWGPNPFKRYWLTSEPEEEFVWVEQWFHANLRRQQYCANHHRPKWEFMQKLLKGART